MSYVVSCAKNDLILINLNLISSAAKQRAVTAEKTVRGKIKVVNAVFTVIVRYTELLFCKVAVKTEMNVTADVENIFILLKNLLNLS